MFKRQGYRLHLLMGRMSKNLQMCFNTTIVCHHMGLNASPDLNFALSCSVTPYGGKGCHKKFTECLYVGSPGYTREHAQFHFQIHQPNKLLLVSGRGNGQARNVTLDEVPKGNISPGNGMTSLQAVVLDGIPFVFKLSRSYEF